jgi:CTP:molybdopterin cytidylyltransferase MocA
MDVPVIVLILAAGASSRMRGADKLLQPVGAETLLRRTARVATATGCPVLVSLPPDRPARSAALEGLPVRPLPVADAASGMSASLRAGVGAARLLVTQSVAGLMVLPADMPEFTTAALAGMIAAFRGKPDLIWRGAAQNGQQGHPAIFPRDLWPDLAQVTGDQGGIGVIRAHPGRVVTHELPGAMAVTDLDTPEDWAAWRTSGRE